MIVPKKKSILNDKGQGFLEFVFLMVIIMMLSFVFVRVANTSLGKLWVGLINMTVTCLNQSCEIDPRQKVQLPD